MPLQDPGHQESRHQEAGGSAVGKAFVEGQHFLQHVAGVRHLRIIFAVEGSHGARLQRDVAAQHIMRALETGATIQPGHPTRWKTSRADVTSAVAEFTPALRNFV